MMTIARTPHRIPRITQMTAMIRRIVPARRGFPYPSRRCRSRDGRERDDRVDPPPQAGPTNDDPADLAATYITSGRRRRPDDHGDQVARFWSWTPMARGLSTIAPRASLSLRPTSSGPCDAGLRRTGRTELPPRAEGRRGGGSAGRIPAAAPRDEGPVLGFGPAAAGHLRPGVATAPGQTGGGRGG